jgi:hypothetical protein
MAGSYTHYIPRAAEHFPLEDLFRFSAKIMEEE